MSDDNKPMINSGQIWYPLTGLAREIRNCEQVGGVRLIRYREGNQEFTNIEAMFCFWIASLGASLEPEEDD